MKKTKERRTIVGEIIISILIGGCLVISGVALIVVLSREEKKWREEQGNR